MLDAFQSGKKITRRKGEQIQKIQTKSKTGSKTKKSRNSIKAKPVDLRFLVRQATRHVSGRAKTHPERRSKIADADHVLVPRKKQKLILSPAFVN